MFCAIMHQTKLSIKGLQCKFWGVQGLGTAGPLLPCSDILPMETCKKRGKKDEGVSPKGVGSRCLWLLLSASLAPGICPSLVPGICPGLLPGTCPCLLPGTCPGLWRGLCPSLLPGIKPAASLGPVPARLLLHRCSTNACCLHCA